MQLTAAFSKLEFAIIRTCPLIQLVRLFLVYDICLTSLPPLDFAPVIWMKSRKNNTNFRLNQRVTQNHLSCSVSYISSNIYNSCHDTNFLSTWATMLLQCERALQESHNHKYLFPIIPLNTAIPKVGYNSHSIEHYW